LYFKRSGDRCALIKINTKGSADHYNFGQFVIIAYFHHMYMDFAEAQSVQYIGEIASYLAAIPVVVVTLYGVLLVHRSGMRWTLGSMFLFAGMIGWVVGGFAPVLDATIPVNVDLHNTPWVPAHLQAAEGGAAAVAGPPDLARGQTLFAQNCAACHGAHGGGGQGPSLLHEPERKNFTLAQQWIIDPAPPMPKLYPASISRTDVRDIAAYVERL
jgi:mono/diheme cytochrome c family protein